MRALAIGSAVVAGPLLATTAMSISGYISSEDVPDDDFSLDKAFISPIDPTRQCWDYGDGTGDCESYGPPPPNCYNPAQWEFCYGGGGSGGGGGGGSSSGGDGGGYTPMTPAEHEDCVRDNLALTLTGQIQPGLILGLEVGAILASSSNGVISGALAWGSPGQVIATAPYGTTYATFLGYIHSHPPRQPTGDSVTDANYAIADMYPSPDDWDELERHATQVMQAGADTSRLSIYIVDRYGSLREFPWSQRATYDVPVWVLTQQISGVGPRPPLPDPILLPRLCT